MRDLILDLASRQGIVKTSDVVKKLHASKSRQYVNLVIRGLVKENLLLKGGSTAGSFYVLPKNRGLIGNEITVNLKREGLEEHRVFEDLKNRMPLVFDLKENINSIVFYAFTEMLNNAIEHSNSPNLKVTVRNDGKNISFLVKDFGIGVFKNVMQKRGLNSELEAIQDLLKGKTTTMPHSHSGEGIFFTSKIADIFILESFKKRLRIDNQINDVFIEEPKSGKKGTGVTFILSLESKKHLNNVFGEFASEDDKIGFDKTEIKVRLFTSGTIYISRSQARRILSGLEKFKTVILDFDRITTIGQAFADEIFRVFKEKHPGINIIAVNAAEPVKFMIDRTQNSQPSLSKPD